MKSTKKHWLDKFVLDTRSVDLFRILLSLTLIYDLVLYRIGSFDTFYSVNGILPVDYCYNESLVGFLSPYFWFKSDAFSIILMYITLAMYILFGLGVGLRYVKPLVWYLHLSLMLRSVSVTYGFNFYTDHALFWAMFLPMGNHFTIFKNKTEGDKFAPSALTVFAFALQVAFVYLGAATSKYGDVWTQGLAVRNMVADSTFASPLQVLITNNKVLYLFLNYWVLLAEYLLPVLIVFMFLRQSNRLRYITIVTILLLHVGIDIFSDVGTFSMISGSIGLLFLPARFWDTLSARTKGMVPQAFTKPLQQPEWVKNILFASIAIMVFMNVMFHVFHSFLNKSLVGKNHNGYILDTRKFPLRHLSIFWQHWGMFAPNPMPDIGWMTMEYQVEGSNQFLNVFNDKPALLNKPVQRYQGLEKFYVYYIRIWPLRTTQKELATYWAEYHQRKFFEHHPELASKATVYVVNYRRMLSTQKNMKTVKTVRVPLTVEQLKMWKPDTPPPNN